MTLLVRNVQVLGASRQLPERADVFISGDRISAIGSFGDKKADEVLDGGGAYLTPGFIDVNTDSDHYLSLFDDPLQEDFLRQGVTTIIGGHCGSSLAPLLYGSLEAIQKWTDISRFNVNWHTVEEFLATLDRKPLGVNFMTLTGHSTIRRAMIGEAFRDLTKNELIVFGEILKRALSEGAAGLSTGLGYVHGRGTPYDEIRSLTGIVKSYGAVYTTHLRKSGEGLTESVGETIRLHEEVGAKVLISHFLPIRGAEREYEAALEAMERLPAERDFHFDLYPFDVSVLPLYAFLPLWVQNGGREVMVSNVSDEWLRPRIMKDFPEIDARHFVVARSSGNDALVGRTLEEIMDIYGIANVPEALLRLMITTRLQASIFYKNINLALAKKGLRHPRSMIASNVAGLSDTRKEQKLERATATFTRFLELVEKENLLPLPTAIQKITEEPAKKFNIKNRGTVREGNFADLACFKDAQVKFTIVNGRVAYRDGAFTSILAGRALRHHGY